MVTARVALGMVHIEDVVHHGWLDWNSRTVIHVFDSTDAHSVPVAVGVFFVDVGVLGVAVVEAVTFEQVVADGANSHVNVHFGMIIVGRLWIALLAALSSFRSYEMRRCETNR